MNLRLWRTSQGGEGVLPGAASVPSPNAANYKRNETEKRMAKPPPVQVGTRVFDPTMTPPHEVSANGYVCTICTKSRTTLRGVLLLLQFQFRTAYGAMQARAAFL